MPFTSNGYYNNPAMGQMAGNLASMFAPPSPQEMLTAQTIAQQNAAAVKKQAILDSLPKSVADVYTMENADPANMAKFKQYQLADSGQPIAAQDPYKYVYDNAGSTFSGKAMDPLSQGQTRILPFGVAGPLGLTNTPAAAAADAGDSDTKTPAATPAAPNAPVVQSNPAADSTKQMNSDQYGALLEQKHMENPDDPVAAANWAAHLKANPRNTGQNININGNPNGIEDGYNKAVGAELADTVKAGSQAPITRGMLLQLKAASDAGGKNITTGPAAQFALKAKEALGSALGVQIPGTSESEVMNNLGTTLAAQGARAMTSRPTQFEFANQLATKPGLSQTPEGMKAIIAVKMAELDDQEHLAALANDPANRANWLQTKKNYYATHPVQSPFFPGQAFGAADIAKLDATSPPPVQPGAAGPITPFNANGAGGSFNSTIPGSAAPFPGATAVSPAPVRVTDPVQARQLPSGTPIILPDGTQGVVP